MTHSDTQTERNPYELVQYEGVQPPAPAWFQSAVATECTTGSVEVDGASISYRCWGDPEKPGLLLVHGNGAHARWYDFIAPAFANRYNVVAMDFSGMGDSDWRDQYSLEQYSAEQMAVMRDAGMMDHAIKPIIAAHSFGGIISLITANNHGELLGGLVMMDSVVMRPDKVGMHPRPRPATKVAFFPDLASALARFRLMPPQFCDNHFIVDYIARHSVKPIEQDGQSGWSWKFDPTIWSKIDWDDTMLWGALGSVNCNFANMQGSHSVLFSDELQADMRSQIDAPFETIEGAGHHLLLDAPLATIDMLNKFLSDWDIAAQPAHKSNLDRGR